MMRRLAVRFPVILIAVMSATVPANSSEPGNDWFVDVSSDVGIDFVHQNGSQGRYHFIETAASGGGWIDFDNDSDPDLYLINAESADGQPLRNVLYENRNGQFVDVTDQAGVGDTGYGMGMCVGDYDSDGMIDFLVTNYGSNRLYRNLGQGKFEERSSSAGLNQSGWSTGCAFADLDRDGDLDLYVTRYVNYDRNAPHACQAGPDGKRAYCHPNAYPGETDLLYINQGDGVFEESGQTRGLNQGRDERGFGVLISDLNDDGHPDIYVANDGSVNRVYINDGKARFTDSSLLSGAALNLAGLAEAGMGVDLGDVDGDGIQDLIVSHFSMESNTLYRGLGDAMFEDATNRFGLATPSFLDVGWGIKYLDFDNDGDLDLAIANGHVQDDIESVEPRLKYAQKNRLMENDNGKRFGDVTNDAGTAWQLHAVSRGLAVADYDSDGKPDLLVTNTNGRVQLLNNRHPNSHEWLGLELTGPPGNVFAVGTRITLHSNTGTQIREIRSGDSFLSQSALRQHFGLADKAGEMTVTIDWPDGHRQTFRTNQKNQYLRIIHDGG